MEYTTPKLDAPIVRVGGAENGQPQYRAVPVARAKHPGYPTSRLAPHNSVIMAFQPDARELARLAAGEPIYIALLTFGAPQQGIIVTAGVDEMSAIYNVPVVHAHD